MIDLKKAQNTFFTYLQQFNLQDDKINLKLIHTLEVVKIARYLSIHEHLDQENQLLAQLIALLHDIGRFEQIKRFNSFNDNNIDHAILGVQILFDEGLIKEFIGERKYDETIKTAILKHSLYQIGNIEDPQVLLHTKLIRDSDKLDNFRVKNTASIQTLFDISEKEFLKQEVSANIIQAIKNQRLIFKAERQNEVDMWVSYFAFVFDLNFTASYQYLIDTKYIDLNMQRFNWSGKLKQQMEFVQKACNDYLKRQRV